MFGSSGYFTNYGNVNAGFKYDSNYWIVNFNNYGTIDATGYDSNVLDVGELTNTGTMNLGSSSIEVGELINGSSTNTTASITAGTITICCNEDYPSYNYGTITGNVDLGKYDNEDFNTVLTSSRSGITGSILVRSHSTLKLLGDLTGDIDGTGTTVLQSDTSAVAADRTVAGSYVYGGAIYNSGTISSITGNFISNSLSASIS